MCSRCNNPARRLATGSASVAAATAIGVVLLLAAGVAYRVASVLLDRKPGEHVKLPVPLQEIPLRIGGWTGEELEIETATDLYMRRHFADDYVSRRYVNAAERLWADAYIVYCSTRLSGILGHQPRVCYPNNGWVWDITTPSQFTSRSGRTVECLVHCFHKPAPAYLQVYVLNFYILDGRVTLSERDFSSLFDRRINLSGDPARYVAQVQISSTTEHSTRALASQMADTIFDHLPDQNGRVGVADTLVESPQTSGAVSTGR
jgi:hypothetical protein